jgi:cytochrome P450
MTETIPVVRSLPVLGSRLDLNTTRMRQFFTRSYLTHGPVYEIRVLGYRVVVLAGLEANRYAAGPGRRHFGSYAAWGPFDRQFGVDKSLISVDGSDHAAMRRVEGRAYSRAHFNATFDRSVAAAEEDLAAMAEGWLAVAPWCKRLITEQVARVVVSGTARPYLDDLVRYVQLSLMATVTRQRPPVLLRWPPNRRAKDRVWAMVDQLVEQRRRMGPGPVPDLIDDILAAAENDPERWGPRDIDRAVQGAFIAGMDTAGNSLAYAIYELGSYPDLVPALVDEVDAAFADGITPEALQRMPRLMEFLFEVLRLHPIAPALERHLLTDIEVGGHRLPAGTHVILANTVTHGLREVFADPDRFDPTRFSAERGEHRTPGAYVPFGVGTHTCAGRGLAEGLLTLDTALLLHRLRFRGDPAYTLKQVARPTPSPDNRLRINVNKRCMQYR